MLICLCQPWALKSSHADTSCTRWDKASSVGLRITHRLNFLPQSWVFALKFIFKVYNKPQEKKSQEGKPAFPWDQIWRWVLCSDSAALKFFLHTMPWIWSDKALWCSAFHGTSTSVRDGDVGPGLLLFPLSGWLRKKLPSGLWHKEEDILLMLHFLGSLSHAKVKLHSLAHKCHSCIHLRSTELRLCREADRPASVVEDTRATLLEWGMWFHYSLAVWPGTSYSISLYLSFLICKMVNNHKTFSLWGYCEK